jgi:hypothetical protein
MDFVQLRKFRSLKKQFAHEIAASKNLVQEMNENDLYEVLLVLEANHKINDALNEYFNMSHAGSAEEQIEPILLSFSKISRSLLRRIEDEDVRNDVLSSLFHFLKHFINKEEEDVGD